MATLQHPHFPSSVASLYFHQQNSAKKSMASPISPTYSSFSAPSPFSSASSASFPNENSPVSESHFDHIPSPVEAVNSNVTVFPAGPVSVQIFAPQGDIAAPYASDFDYGMMALASDLKKPQALPRQHPVSFHKHMDPVYIPPPLPPHRHNQATSPSAPQTPAHHNLHTQQSLAPPPATANDVMFDVDLDDWSASQDAMGTHAHPGSAISFHPVSHSAQPCLSSSPLSNTKSDLCSIFSSSYPSATMDQPTLRPKQEDLVFEGGMSAYSAVNVHHSPAENHAFEIANSVGSPPHNADAAAALSQARTSSRQYHQHQSSTQAFFPPSQLSRLAYGQHQFVTVHPAEISPLDSCPSNSPLSAFTEMASSGIGVANSEGCDPGGFMCATDEDFKGPISLELGVGMSMTQAMHTNWNGERRLIDGELGDDDAEGEEVDLSDVEQQPFPTSLPNGSPLLPATIRGEGEDGEPTNDTDGSKFSEEDSSTDSDDSEFIPGSRQRRPRRPQATTVSSSYPSYHPEGRRLRTRSGTRYTPYPNDFPSDHNMPDYLDSHLDEAFASMRSKRFSAPLDGDLALSAADYLNFSTLSTSSGAASRRRPRPSNTLPVPVPVPNLTKKSRGRRVPTVSSLEDLRSASSGAGKKRQSAGKSARMYLCEVEGCGKCFARGEHLKRHVRSIHTYEKPHRCPYPGCGKDFSRHDNLGQHMRVHKDYVPPTKV
ncbi:hypothetical protein NP233_g7161 [Leucocoprinus birnbaumii]|uniref:C2H2-type domain-containing protein n=1 Tax=Leucocoprinus birnbaumii TaxID=56174 RepID=A0AAD5VS47_9AGAR|nr:hypothetical protein NP233_g7161 [Leucocoprinus birnbaumii]